MGVGCSLWGKRAHQSAASVGTGGLDVLGSGLDEVVRLGRLQHGLLWLGESRTCLCLHWDPPLLALKLRASPDRDRGTRTTVEIEGSRARVEVTVEMSKVRPVNVVIGMAFRLASKVDDLVCIILLAARCPPAPRGRTGRPLLKRRRTDGNCAD